MNGRGKGVQKSLVALGGFASQNGGGGVKKFG